MTSDDFNGEDPPDWRPLIAVVPLQERGSFMYMGWLAIDGKRLHHYKHIGTRRYLFLTDETQTYRFVEEDLYAPQPPGRAIRHVFEDLEHVDPRDDRCDARELVAACVRRQHQARGMLAYHEENDGQATR